MHVLISEAGLVSEGTAMTGVKVLREPALKALKQWTYKPYLLNGNPFRSTRQ